MKLIQQTIPKGDNKHKLVGPLLFFLVILFEKSLKLSMKFLTENKKKRGGKQTRRNRTYNT